MEDYLLGGAEAVLGGAEAGSHLEMKEIISEIS